MIDDVDGRIADFLRAPERAPDEQFVAAMRIAVEADIRLGAARAAARRDLARNAAALAVVLAAFVFLGRLEAPASAEAMVPLHSPAMLGFMLLALWAAVDLPMPRVSRS